MEREAVRGHRFPYFVRVKAGVLLLGTAAIPQRSYTTMRRNFSALVGIGSVAAMIALGIWYLQEHPHGMFYGMSCGFLGRGMLAGSGMGLIMMLLWIVFF